MGYLNNQSITVDAILTKKGRELLSKGRQYFNITKFALADDEIDYHLWNANHPSGSNYYGYAIEQLPILEPNPDETQNMRYRLVSLNKDTVRIPVISIFPASITFAEGQQVDITVNTIQGASSAGTGQSVNLNAQLGYTAILHNSDAAYLQVTDAAPAAGTTINSVEAQIASVKRAISMGGTGKEDFTPAQLAVLEQQLLMLERTQQILAMGGGLTGVGTGVFLGDTDASKSIFAIGLKFRLVAKGLTALQSSMGVRTTLTVVGNETGGSASISVVNTNLGNLSTE